MEQKPVTILISIFIGLFVLYSISNIFISAETKEETEGIIVYKSDKNITEKIYWTGLPISTSNKLYVEPSKDMLPFIQEFRAELKQNFDNLHDTIIADAIYEKYSTKIGMNGIIDGFFVIGKEMQISLAVIHHIGEYIFSKATNVKDGIEICSRPILSKAPLHGYVWAAIQSFSSNHFQNLESSQYLPRDKLKDLFEFVDQELCYFRTANNMSNIYVTCVHSVGHALGFIFNKEQIVQAISVCAMPDNLDFNYACTTGLYMSFSDGFSKTSFSPCDTNDFPASCFRFMGPTFKYLAENRVIYPCSSMPNQYHKIACVWGEANSLQIEPTKTFDFCKKYRVPFVEGFLDRNNFESEGGEEKYKYRQYIACISGGLSKKIDLPIEKMIEKTCSKFEGDKYAQKYCESTSTAAVNEYIDEESLNYNYELLEFDYNSNDVLLPVPFPFNPDKSGKNKGYVDVHL